MNARWRVWLGATIGWSVCAGTAVGRVPADFEPVARVLVSRCVECHRGDTPAGGLDLTRRATVLRGGDSGVAVVAGRPTESLLVRRLAAGEMPPEVRGVPQRLAHPEITILEQWIAAGAVWPDDRELDLYESTSEVRGGRDWWSLQPIQPVRIPPTNSIPVRNPIDAFIGAELDRRKMSPAPPASRRARIRRLYFTTVGLPPAMDDIVAFERARDPHAWDQLVDRMLASPRFGERWARHWLDVVRFAETSGYERDQEKSFAWKYRDWVVSAINDDLPYDQFLIHQLAGDEISDRSLNSVIATGFLRLGTWNDEPNDDQDYRYERLEDLVHATSSAFLGLTVKCARCHDHKFDPIPQDDYYRFAAAFWPGPLAARDRQLLGGPSAAELGFDEVLGWTDLSAEPAKLFVLGNGDRRQPLREAPAGPLSAIPNLSAAFPPPPPGARTTGRRRQLADWMVRGDHPLVARVIVNRIWQHHFGEGLVRSPNNFGFRGQPPTHPELLDWLAGELIRAGWRLKPIHRLILQSATWQQSSTHPAHEDYVLRDASNRALWRAQHRRLDAESLRDALLACAGELDLRIGGPSFRPPIATAALEGLSRKSSAYQISPPAEQRRRSLYIYNKRHLLPPFMTTFDLTDTTLPCAQRNVTTVPTQSLALLNNQLPHEQSRILAARIHSVTDDRRQAIAQAWTSILRRRPSTAENELADRYLINQTQRFAAGSGDWADLLALASLCHVLFNCNEFLYVD